MQLSRNAKGTIAFMIAIMLGHIWSAITPVYKPPWQPYPPLVPLMVDYIVPFLVNYYRPIFIGLLGLTIVWVWEGKRAGYLVALVLSAIGSAFGVIVTIFNVMAQEWQGVFTGAVSIAFPAVMALWFAYHGYRAEEPDA